MRVCAPAAHALRLADRHGVARHRRHEVEGCPGERRGPLQGAGEGVDEVVRVEHATQWHHSQHGRRETEGHVDAVDRRTRW